MQEIAALLTALPAGVGARNCHVGNSISIIVTWSHWPREQGKAGTYKPIPTSKVYR